MGNAATRRRHAVRLVAMLSLGGLLAATMTTVAAADTPRHRTAKSAGLQSPESGSCGTDVPALGTPIDTAFGRALSVKIGDKEYAPGSPLLHVVVVNRCTLEVRAHQYSDRGQDIPAVKALVEKLDAKSLVVVAAPYGLGLSHARAEDLNRDVLRPIGATPIPINQLERPFSVIGAPGWTTGSAFQNTGSRLGVPGQPETEPGSLRGYLQKDIATQAFNFVFPDFVRVTTRSASTPSSNTMAIGSNVLVGPLPANRSGFQLVVVNSRTLGVAASNVYATNGGDPNVDQQQQELFGDALRAVNANQIAFVQSIGTPAPTSISWNRIAEGIDTLGGERTIINQLSGQSYGLIASPAWRSAAEESVTDDASQQVGAVGSLLGRTPQSGFRPLLTDSTGVTAGNELIEVAFEPSVRWPLRDTPGRLAAIKYIGGALQLKVDDPRLRYTDLGIAFSDAQYLGKLQTMQYPGDPSFSAVDFDLVKAQLEQEFGWVSKVRSYVDRLHQVATGSVISQSVLLNRATREIRAAVSNAPVEVNPEEVLSILAKMAGIAAKHAGEPQLAGALTFLSGAFSLSAMVTKGPKGETPLETFTVQKDQLSDELAERFGGTIRQLGQLRSILVTDAGKLAKAGGAIEDGAPGWKLTDDVIAVAQRSEEIAAQQLYASVLLRIPYVAYRLPDGFPTPTTCRVLGPNQPASAWMTYISGFTQQGSKLVPHTTGWAIGTAQEDDRSGRMVAQANLIDPLFKPISPDFTGTGIGLYKPRFLATNFAVRDLPKVNCMTR